MREVNMDEPATIRLVATAHMGDSPLDVDVFEFPFLTFRQAVVHFLTVLTQDERATSSILTASGVIWLAPEIEETFKSSPA
jgi:hypothetical protein